MRPQWCGAHVVLCGMFRSSQIMCQGWCSTVRMVPAVSGVSRVVNLVVRMRERATTRSCLTWVAWARAASGSVGCSNAGSRARPPMASRSHEFVRRTYRVESEPAGEAACGHAGSAGRARRHVLSSSAFAQKGSIASNWVAFTCRLFTVDCGVTIDCEPQNHS